MATTPSRPAIAAAGLRKSFGDQVVLDGIDLQVAKGTVFALLGPNGAGKTTTVHILSTLIGADAGEMAVAGHDVARDPDAVRAAIGVTGQLTAVDNLLTGEENLLLMADLRHLGRREGRRLVISRPCQATRDSRVSSVVTGAGSTAAYRRAPSPRPRASRAASPSPTACPPAPCTAGRSGTAAGPAPGRSGAHKIQCQPPPLGSQRC